MPSKIFFKLYCNDNNIKDMYISHCDSIIEISMYYYKVTSRKRKKSKRYLHQIVQSNGGMNNWTIEYLEEFTYETDDELNARKAEWIEKLQPAINLNETKNKQSKTK